MPRKKRAANNTGSIYRRSDGRYGYSYTAPDGKQINRTAKTEAEAVQRLNAVIASMTRGEYVNPSAMTVEGWLCIWLEGYAPNTAKASTIDTYRTTLENRLIPALGKYKLQTLRVDTIQALVNQQQKGAHKLAPSSIRQEMSILKRALGQAVENQLITRNPASAVKLPKIEQKEIKFLSTGETAALLEALPMTTQRRAIRFILGTGLRVSELCGLRWCDLTAEGLNVNQTLYIVEGKRLSEEEYQGKRLVGTTPKTEAGRRFIPFNDKLSEIIAQQRHAQRLERMRTGDAWQGGEPCKGEQFIFATACGTSTDRHNIARTLRSCFDRIGLERRGPHALRHTFATRWVQSGKDPVTLSKILGHSNVAFTMKIYVHADNASKQDGMNFMANLI